MAPPALNDVEADRGDVASAASSSTTSSKLRPPSSRGMRAPLVPNPLNTNVTTRKRRSVSVPPKDVKPAPSGIIRGQRTADIEATAEAVNKAIRTRAQREAVEDPKWQQFEARRNAGTNVYGAKPRSTSCCNGPCGRTLTLNQLVPRCKRNGQEHLLSNRHIKLETEVREMKNQELQHRRGLIAANEELAALKKAHERKVQELENEKRQLERQLKDVREDFRLVQNDLQMERDAMTSLKSTVAQHASIQLSLKAQLEASQRLASSLQQEVERRLGSASELQLQLETVRKRNEFLEAEAQANEQIRRRLHNQIQELKGNIRVYVRVRPVVPGEKDEAGGQAAIEFPDTRDHQQIVLTNTTESAMGSQRKEALSFTFDRVFEPQATQLEVFEEVSQLVQSVVDGYNVTIFAYGQTGSGKSHTMLGTSPGSPAEGMIPRAVRQIFQTGEGMRSKGWEYTMEGQFLEIYNETINDLLGYGEFDSKKHEIKHDKSGRTTVTDTVTLPLNGPSQVATLLARAESRRSVAATLMNQRSSRSHSVFTLRVSGTNTITGESCEGCLNLVDLAGSERLSSSGAANDKDRLRETQAINKSLSALGDVIASLGVAGDNGKQATHIPYRNSKLTYLLQNSLGGNSKTLMILNLSPMAAHLGESLCSLRFATKVNNTTIGRATAKKLAAAP
ncbi:Kinesin-like protein klpA [Serendipita indica DSM 11827]|nr:Kinesin-like protein klpA [Serendipita indica DSM 11827]